MSWCSTEVLKLVRTANVDPEDAAQDCLMLTLSESIDDRADAHKWTIITIHLTPLPRRVRERIVEECFQRACGEEPDAFLFGGNFHSTSFWLENRRTKLASDIEHTVLGNDDLNELQVMSWSANDFEISKLDDHGPYTLVFDYHDPKRDEPPAEPLPGPPRKVARGSTSTDARSASSSSAAPPAAICSTRKPDPPTMIKLDTPLYDQLLEGLEENQATELMGYIQKCCFVGADGNTILKRTPLGERIEKAMPLSAKMEELLRVVHAKRKELAREENIPLDELADYTARPEEYRKLMKNWMDDVGSWMHAKHQETYQKLREDGFSQRAHPLKKRCFQSFCFNISGCKFRLFKHIILPIVHGVDGGGAETIKQLVVDFQRHKKTQQYKDAVARSKRRQEGERRLSEKLWWARWELYKGRECLEAVRQGTSFWDLNYKSQYLVTLYWAGDLERALSELKKEKSVPSRVAHPEAAMSAYETRLQ